MSWGTVITAVITGVPGIAALVALLLSRRQNEATADKTEAEAAVVIQGAALQLLVPLQKRIKELEDEVRELREDVQQARDLLRENDIPLPNPK